LKNKTLLILTSALLTSLAFHPLKLHFLAWFSLVPLLFAVAEAKPSAAFRSGLTFGALFALFSLFWIVFLQIPGNIWVLMVFGLILMFLYLGLYWAVGILVANRVGIWFLPFVVAGLEWAKGLGELGFPWLSLGYSQARYPAVIQQAALYGVYGVSFWLVLVNVVLFKLLRTRQWKYLIAAVLVFGGPLVYGFLRIPASPPPALTLGVVQPNIDPNLKFTHGMRGATFKELIDLSRQCDRRARDTLGRPCDLILWPESVIPVLLKSANEYQRTAFDLADELNTPILTGTAIIDHTRGAIYNGAVLVEPGRIMSQEYRKIHLVPFGEHIPFDRYIPLFRKIDLGEGDYSPGSEFTVFKTRAGDFSCLICFESIFPELARTFVRRGARLLVNITNDGWFGRISGPQQHNDMAILRAVENNVPLARSSNTGISMVVDGYGRILAETPLFVESYLVRRVPAGTGRTPYQSLGDILPALGLILLPLLLAIAAIYRH
jgi:apolipoprotein N-acyltransferase